MPWLFNKFVVYITYFQNALKHFVFVSKIFYTLKYRMHTRLITPSITPTVKIPLVDSFRKKINTFFMQEIITVITLVEN